MALDESSGSISPLPGSFRTGLRAETTVGLVSLVLSTLLFMHISWGYTVLIWRECRQWRKHGGATIEEEGVDLSMGLSQRHYEQTKTETRQGGGGGGNNDASSSQTSTRPLHQHHSRAASGTGVAAGGAARRRRAWHNPHLLLIFNIISADVSFSVGHVISLAWLQADAIDVDWAGCRAQGWLISFGSVNTSAFLLLLAAHTFLGLVRGWQPSMRVTAIQSVCVWIATVLLPSVGPMATKDEHYYARQQFWCFVAPPNAGWRLSVYIPGTLFLVTSIVLYIATLSTIAIRMRATSKAARLTSRQRTKDSDSSSAPISNNNNNNTIIPNQKTPGSFRLLGHHPAFLVYPAVYTLCVLPITASGFKSDAEFNTPFMTFAVVMLAAVGTANATVWSATLLLSREEDMIATGLDHFRFMRTPEDRRFGNIVFVQGGGGGGKNSGPHDRLPEEPRRNGGWWFFGGSSGGYGARNVSDGELPLRGVQNGGSGSSSQFQGGSGAIQLDVSTTVVVEDDFSRSLGGRSSLKSLGS